MNRFELEVEVKVEQLIERLKENKAKHRGVFEQALAAFKEKAVALLNERIDQIKNGKTLDTYVHMDMPEDHTDDYDRALRMLTLHERDTITLPEEMFRQFYEDEWSWRARWEVNTASYVSQ